MNPSFSRIIQFILLLFIAALLSAAAHAETSGATPPHDATSGTHTSRYGRGYEARQGLDIGDRGGRVERPERIERIERPERPERPERIDRIERPGRVERIERIERPGRDR